MSLGPDSQGRLAAAAKAEKTERTALLAIGVLSSLAGIVTAIFLWDRPAQAALHGQLGTPWLELADVVGVLGQPWPYIGLGVWVLLFWGIVEANTGFSLKKLLLVYRALLILSASTGSWLAASALQTVFGRSRPHLYFEHGVYAFHPFNMTPDFSSFPSSHAAISAAMAAVFSIFLPVYRVTFFWIAALVATSRIVTENHYLSDAVAGTLVGLAVVAALESSFRHFGIQLYPTRPKWP